MFCDMYAPAEKEVDQIFQTFYNAPSFNSWQISLIKGTLLLRWSWQRIRLTISDRIFHLTAVCTYNDGDSCYDEYLKNTSHTEEKFVSISRKPKFKPQSLKFMEDLVCGRFLVSFENTPDILLLFCVILFSRCLSWRDTSNENILLPYYGETS